MEQSIEKRRAFALAAIRPYAKDPSLCGYDPKTGACMNLTKEGKMCVAGKFMLPEIRESHKNGTINAILWGANGDQSKIFVPEAVDILSQDEWVKLQDIHDSIASKEKNGDYSGKGIMGHVKALGLFTYEEMMDFSTL
jgi:hypothetical protein